MDPHDPSKGTDPSKEAFNTIDAEGPTSSMNALGATQRNALFEVRWSGSDGAGSGVASYDVFVSDNSGPFALFLDDTTQTSAIFPGVDGHTYGFFSVATDNVGFRELAPGTADTTTTVNPNDSPNMASLAVSPDPVSQGQSLTLTANGVNDPDGSVSRVEFFRDANLDGIGQPGEKLGEDVNGADGFSLTTAVTWAVGAHTYLARAIDNEGATGAFVGKVATNDSDENPFNFSIAGSVLPGIGVAIGDGAARALTYTEQDRTVVTVTLKGGTATVWLQGENLLPTAGKKGVTVDGNKVVEIAEIALASTTAQSSLTFATKGGNGFATVEGISGNTLVGKLTGKGIDLGGIAMTGRGSVAAIDVHSILEGADLMMPGAGNLAGTTLKAVRIGAGAEIELGSGLKSLTAGEWSDGSLTAPWAAKITIAGDFGADLLLNGAGNPKQTLGSLTVKGNARGNGQDVRWDIDGVVGTVNIAGLLDEIDLRVAGTINTITVGGARKSRIFAGVKDNVDALPGSPGDFIGGPSSEIKSLTIKGSSGITEPSFEGSMVAALSLGKVTIKEVEKANGGTPFGIAADRIKSYARTGIRPLSNLGVPPKPPEVDSFGDYVVRLL